jgi:polysaccharide deacetylase 2 family uncharacterized protein YibQ
MAVSNRNKFKKNTFKKKSSGLRIAVLTIFFLIVAAVAGYVLLSYFKKAPVTHRQPEQVLVEPAVPAPPRTQTVIPEAPAPTATPPDYKEQNIQPSTEPLPETEKPGSGTGTSGRLAIIIDDMGSSISEARSLAEIGVPLTFSIIPGLRNNNAVVSFAASRHIETMVHIPMQSKGWPGRRLESNGLLISMDDSELRERVATLIREVPGAVGVNNHTGSEFTEHADKMRSVLEVLKGEHLFFVDSVTTPHSTALEVAQQLGLKSARRNVFLDNEQDSGYILGQLAQAVKLAKKTGSAIAICHPHPVTISALASALPALERQGVTLVPASHLVR